MPILPRTALYASDLMTGVLATLASRGVREFSVQGDAFDRAFKAAYDELKRLAESYEIVLAFRVTLHPIHGDSEVAQEAFYEAMSSRILSTDSPPSGVARIRIRPDEAGLYLARLPGGQGLYEAAASAFSGA